MADKSKTQVRQQHNGITAEYLRTCLIYDPADGSFVWLERENKHKRWNSRFAGKRAGGDSRGYRVISIDGIAYYGQRLAWLYMTGEWPKDLVDHRDGNELNNQFKNLREATNRQNLRNMKIRQSNKSGFKGVSWSKPLKRWVAFISTGETNKYLGSANTAAEAHEIWKEAATRLHGEFARFE